MSAAISTWVARLLDEPLDPRAAKAFPTAAPSAKREAAARDRVRRIATRAPEVMVKITGSARNARGARAAAAYIAREGGVSVEDERGERHAGPKAAERVIASWQRSGLGIPESGARRRETLQIMLSMPRECDRDIVRDAARAWARETFADERPWLMAQHDDTAQPHVHFVVAVGGYDGRRLNPKKADLRLWRERFAEALRERGIEAEATSRAVRGSTRRHVPRSVMYADRSRYATGERAEPLEMTRRRTATRASVRESYRLITAALERGDAADRALARDVRAFVGAQFGAGAVRERSASHERDTGPDIGGDTP